MGSFGLLQVGCIWVPECAFWEYGEFAIEAEEECSVAGVGY